MGLEINHLIKRYGGKTVLHGISLEARTGQAFGLLGGNGAGKTTTIRSVLGLVEYESGSITWDGKPIKDNRPSIGYLPEERGLYPKEKVSEQLVYFAMLEGLSRPAAVKAMRGWLERLGIAEHEGKRVEQLSKGNQQRCRSSRRSSTIPSWSSSTSRSAASTRSTPTCWPPSCRTS